MDGFDEISLREALTLNDRSKYLHCVHCLLYCTEQENEQSCRFALMQMRHDGCLGFPGGECDDTVATVEQLVANLNRELEEEICFDAKRNAVNASNYVFTHRWLHAKSNRYFVLHFFAKELSVAAFQWIECNHMKAVHFSSESLGLIRVPILKANNDCKRCTCFANFMENFEKQQFAGNAKEQFLGTVKKLNLL